MKSHFLNKKNFTSLFSESKNFKMHSEVLVLVYCKQEELNFRVLFSEICSIFIVIKIKRILFCLVLKSSVFLVANQQKNI